MSGGIDNISDCYVYELSPNLLKTLKVIHFDNERREVDAKGIQHETVGTAKQENSKQQAPFKPTKDNAQCQVCALIFDSLESQRQHFHSQVHTINVKRSIRGLPIVTEVQLTSLEKEQPRNVEDAESEESGNESSEVMSEDEFDDYKEPTTKYDYENDNDDENGMVSHLHTRMPQLLFHSELLATENHALAIYKALFSSNELQKPLTTLSDWNSTDALRLNTAISGLFMVGGGHFAGAIVSHLRKNVKGNMAKKNDLTFNEQAVEFYEHKTFHRYTTRRKQGGSQTAMDNAKGKAHSAGSTLRRYNEAALKSDIQNLVKDWAPYLLKCQNIFIRARNVNERRTLLESIGIAKNDERVKSFPFTTGRPTIKELKRAWCELTYIKKIDMPDPIEITKKSTPKSEQPQTTKALNEVPVSAEEKHTEEMIKLLQKGRAPLLMAYLKKNGIDVNFKLEPKSKYNNTPTLLHFASQNGLKQMSFILINNMKADVTILNAQGKTPYQIAKTGPTRQSFQIARHTLGEDYCDWNSAGVSEPLTREQAEQINKVEIEAAELEAKRLLDQETKAAQNKQRLAKEEKRGPGVKLSGMPPSTATQNLNSLTEEQKKRFMREQRARAAEARIQKLSLK